ncbi:pyrroloquinoline quinone biosynthesis protein E [Rhodoblastus acidophilus]|uniref:pyrroloquinoline quinone biosynthesis protein PqqE n=1 Tax=Rhodoblastus acidophilus TaxID=1074 RepID=UPI00222449D2|nr:pyrroloquinoline quinone biosynthesis protein PqqE [Rhodoblastus acidophilus]MCW2283399.1 pyrroloquinoline quinone biosynthesis protein E [Rhodoblastus acidophilus]MCW2332277.1 pyrroloquinoline quinone biosynthesis protein E [Rhodoblastus acidophilus]
MKPLPPPTGMLAELTYRCPLSCPYCSNPLEMAGRDAEMSTQEWKRIFSQAAEIGVLHAHLSGGEPASRRDLLELTAHAAQVGLYTNLITSGVGLTKKLFDDLVAAGLDHVQLSIQDAEPESADAIGGYRGGFAKKLEVAQWVAETGMPLTVNAVIHRLNISRAAEMVDFAVRLGARRIEIAHTQYYGWALRNRAHLMPTRAQSEKAYAEVEARRALYKGRIVIDHVAPDYHAKYPKACMSGWGRLTFNVTPTGKVLPCHAAETIPNLEFWNTREKSLADCWSDSPGFNAFRGTEWMKEPCRSCERKNEDFGGCRCQALALAGDAAATDPICSKSPLHHLIGEIAARDSSEKGGDFTPRRMAAAKALTDV